MFLTFCECSFTCPVCQTAVSQAAITAVNAAYTAAAQGALAGCGHLVVQVGKNLAVRCGQQPKTLMPMRAALVDRRVVELAGTCQGQAPPAAKRRA